MQRRLQDKVLFGSDYPGCSAAQCCDEWDMEGFKPGIIEKLLFRNAARNLKLENAVAAAGSEAEHGGDSRTGVRVGPAAAGAGKVS